MSHGEEILDTNVSGMGLLDDESREDAMVGNVSEGYVRYLSKNSNIAVTKVKKFDEDSNEDTDNVVGMTRFMSEE